MGDSDLARAVHALQRALRKLEGRYMLIGGLAVNLRGFPRHTDDIETGIELDVSLAWLPFEEEAVAAAQLLEVEGTRLPVVRVEDLLIYKAIAWRERDRRDIRESLALHRGEIELDRLREIIGQFDDARDEPGRLEEFERIIDEGASS